MWGNGKRGDAVAIHPSIRANKSYAQIEGGGRNHEKGLHPYESRGGVLSKRRRTPYLQRK